MCNLLETVLCTKHCQSCDILGSFNPHSDPKEYYYLVINKIAVTRRFGNLPKLTELLSSRFRMGLGVCQGQMSMFLNTASVVPVPFLGRKLPGI